MNEFKNRTGTKINRKKYVIEEIKDDGKGNLQEFIAYESRYDDEEDCEISNIGTKLTAENMNTIVNNLAETKVFEVFRTLETTLDKEMNSITFDEAVMNTYTLPTVTELGAKITWEAVSDNVQVNGNRVTVTRRINDTNGILKGTFVLGYMQKSKLITIPIKGTLVTEISSYPETIEWNQGENNYLEFFIETNDESKLVFDDSEIEDDNEDTLEYLNLDILKVSNSKLRFRLSEKDILKETNKTGSEVFYFFINVYIDNILNENNRQLYIELTYNYASTTPED